MANKNTAHPKVVNFLRYAAAYGLLFVCFFAGVWIIESLRTNIFDIGALLKADEQLVYLLYSWGSYFLYAPFLILVVILEAHINTAARTGQLSRSARVIILVEGGIGLVSVLITVVLSLLHLRPSL